MVRKLYLLRHGEAANDFEKADRERTLTVNGKNKVRALGIKLNHAGFYPEKVYCSPAVRTKQTAEILLEQLGFLPKVDFQENIYEASTKTLFDLVASSSDEYEKILLIGHNPAISFLFDYLTIANFGSLMPGELVCVGFENKSWNEISKGSGTKENLTISQ